MAYRLASLDRVEFAIAPFSGTTFGAVTMAAFVKRTTIGSTDVLTYFGTAGLSDRSYMVVTNTNKLGLHRGGGPVIGTTSIASTTTYYLLAVTCATGTATPRIHIHDGTSWVHENASGTVGAAAALGGTDRLLVSSEFGTTAFVGDFVCAGIKKADSSDAAIETLSRTAFSAWRSFGFDWLIGFDSSLEAAGILQDQASPGTGDEIAITGTTVVADPPGWTWATAIAPVANFTAAPLSGAFPLSVAFTDTSTNTPTSWAWTFGDGGTSTSQNPTHNYTTPGTYTVTLTATNVAGSDGETKTGYVTVSNPPRPVRVNTTDGWVEIADATSFVSGTGAPTAAIGATGAIYLDTASGRVYGPKAAGAWPATALGRLLLPGNTYADVAARYGNYAALLAG